MYDEEGPSNFGQTLKIIYRPTYEEHMEEWTGI